MNAQPVTVASKPAPFVPAVHVESLKFRAVHVAFVGLELVGTKYFSEADGPTSVVVVTA